MAQTTEGKSFCSAIVEVWCPCSGAWVDMSGWTTAVAETGGDRPIGETYTGDADLAIITAGKRGPREVTCRYVYTEGACDPFQCVREVYECDCGGTLSFRWTPRGTGYIFTISGYVTSFRMPTGEYSSPDAILGEFTVTGAEVDTTI